MLVSCKLCKLIMLWFYSMKQIYPSKTYLQAARWVFVQTSLVNGPEKQICLCGEVSRKMHHCGQFS